MKILKNISVNNTINFICMLTIAFASLHAISEGYNIMNEALKNKAEKE
ncbi:MAG: hypothetical protein GY781_06020 [Gammaproteobacteria bacterium]|nr:hypothetical protein [Gammaproteobacteria bacterium]